MAVPAPVSDSRPAAVGLFSLPVIVAALGYFVDIYDLLLFGIVRVPSLKDLGLTAEQISTVGTSIMNWQMGGLLIGGILWGVLGDKRGRLSVLFGSIITYSIANIACGFVKSVTFMEPTTYYALMRFVAGVGLAGELGAGITLVSEVLPKEKRAIGTSLVAGIGLSGAVVAYFTVKLFDWQTAFLVGGGLGIGLLMLRVGVVESGMFKGLAEQTGVSRGNFFAFFTSRDRLSRYLKCIGIGLPTWFVIGILATFANEFGRALGIAEEIQPGLAIMWCYVGLAAGDLASGFISQAMASRKKGVALLMAVALVFSVIFLFGGVRSAVALYALCLAAGFGIGYWAMFVTIGAEQFGTNLRATAATTVPNMVRGLVIPMTLTYQALKPSLAEINAAAVVGLIAFILGFYAILTIPETHGRDLDFLED
ncbi:MFS transporter [Spirosoma luteolum]